MKKPIQYVSRTFPQGGDACKLTGASRTAEVQVSCVMPTIYEEHVLFRAPMKFVRQTIFTRGICLQTYQGTTTQC